MADEPLQPDSYKAKIPNTLAYPIGYEALRDVLGDLPHWDELKFRFRDRPEYWASDFAKILREGTPYRILRVSFSSLRPTSHPGWSIEVYPVLRHLKHAAFEALQSDALESAKEYIFTSRLTSHSRAHLDFIFDPITKSISQETRSTLF